MRTDLNPTALIPKTLKTAFLTCLCVLFLATTAYPQQRNSIPITTGTWNLVLTQGIPGSSNDWEQLVYAPVIHQSIMLSQYHQTDSEPNMSLIGYNVDTNSWDVVDMGGLFHTENMPEGGESQGYFDFNPSNETLVFHCCTTGSNQPENANHTWWYDLAGQSGRDEQTSPEPPFGALQPGGAFDVAHNVFVMFGGASNVGTWVYDPTANSWQQKTPGGTPPNPSLSLPAAAYSSNAQQVFLYGGFASGTYYSDLYTYNASSDVWTKISPVGGVKPPARYRTNFAYDSTNNVFLLFGGTNASGVLVDTWVYDPVANTWTQLSPSQSPAINAESDFAKMSYDSEHNVFVLAHKGNGGYFGGSWTTLAIQTWLFRYKGTGPNAGTLASSAQPAAGGLNRNTVSWAKEPTLASSGNSLYVAWSETGSPFDVTNRTWLHIYADQYTSSSWVPIGSSYQSISAPAVAGYAPSLALVNGTPWVSWYATSLSTYGDAKIYAGSWNGSTWQSQLIGLVNSQAYQGRSQMANIAGVPSIAFLEVNKGTYPQSVLAYVKVWNGTSWTLQGGAALNRSGAIGTTASSLSITSDGTNPYAVWTEYNRTFPSGGADVSTPPQVYVSHWNGSQWVAVGGALNVNTADLADDASIAYFAGKPYVAWTERTQTGNAQLYVATWNGTTWTVVGSGPLNQGGASGWAFHPSLVADPVGNQLYLGWVEQTALGQKARVYVSQLAGTSWKSLGNTLNADSVQGSAQRVSIGVFNGQPVAAWGEIELGALRQVYVSQWNGSNWMQLSGTGGPPDTTPPTTPTGVSAVAVSSSQINISWSGATDTVGVAGYYVNRNGSQIGNVTTVLSYQDTGLNPGTTYTYTVAAYDAAGNVSAMSSAAKGTTLGSGSNPSVSITAPANGATVSGTITLSANATDSAGIVGVQLQVDGGNLGSQVTGSGPTYSTSWNTTTVANGSHTVTAIATDTGNRTASSSITVTVNNTGTSGLVISGVSAGSVTSSGATITWTTNVPASSQVAYGTTSSYNLMSPLNSALVTSHSVSLSSLSASTTYDYQVLSQDSNGDMASSANYTFTTAPAGLQTALQIQGNASEVSGTNNGSLVTPSTTTSGFTGVVVVNGTGSVNFTPAQGGNGVYFLNCCKNTNDAYYHFTGTTVGNIFDVNQGQVSFSMQSRYSFAQRKANAAAPRYAFDVRDGNGNHLFWFLTQVTTNGLQFNYTAGGPGQYYYVPQGTEDTLFGAGVILQVTLAWSGSGLNLYLNNTLVKSTAYKVPVANWSATSLLDFGADEYETFGGYNVSDDVIFNFTVETPVSQ
jgi:hypothetical protein